MASSVMSSLDCISKERRLPLPIKIRVHLALVQSVLLYASETWTLTSADAKSLEVFHMKCQRRILRISCRQFVCNSEISALTGLRMPSTASSDIVASPSLATSPDCRTAPQHIKPYSLTSTSHSVLLESSAWSPTWRWIDQIRNDTSQTPADLWRQALGRGHHGRATRRPTLAMRR